MSLKPFCVVGLDLSLTGLGMVAIPDSWGLDFEQVKRRTLASVPEREMVDRIADLASDVVRWVEWACEGTTPVVAIEGGIMGAKLARSVRSQNELAGVVKHELRRRLQALATTVEQSSARKTLLGKIPPRDRKAAVIAFLRPRTRAAWEPDEYDAFVVANYRLRGLGLPHIYTEPPPKVKKPRRPRKAA
jgi:hypothetical protein